MKQYRCGLFKKKKEEFQRIHMQRKSFGPIYKH